jgi:hypothetical protein
MHSHIKTTRFHKIYTTLFLFYKKKNWPVLKEKDKYSFCKAFLFKKRFVKICVIEWL